MVNYVTTQGIIRDFSDISLVSVKNGVAEVVQHLTSIDNGSQTHEVRKASVPVLPGQSREELMTKLNEDSDIIINKHGKLATLKMTI